MKIQLKSITLLNFKGIRDLTIDFNAEGITSIYGKNAIGKTTIFDAFTWLLFGKDSTDRKDFNIRTLDAGGSVIEKLPHEVSATIIVEGVEIRLRKCYDEVWAKKRGSSIEEYKGNEVHPFINDVPLSVTEYQKKINEICDESIFKLITNPLCMPTMKKDAQRQTLFAMAGELKDEDIAAGNKDFINLLNNLTGKSLDEYKRQVAAQKKRIKDELKDIPGRIDERKRSMPATENWVELENELQTKKEGIKGIDTQLEDITKAYESDSKARVSIVKDISNKKVERETIKNSIENDATSDFRDKKNKRQSLISQLSQCRTNESSLSSSINDLKGTIEDLKSKRDELLSSWYSINEEQITFDENQFICPTCKRTLDSDNIEARKEELTQAFNEDKAKRLTENQKKGLSVKAQMESNSRTLGDYEKRLKDVQDEIDKILSDELYKAEPICPDTAPIVASDERYIKITKEIAELEKLAEKEVTPPDNSELKEARSILLDSCRELEIRLGNKKTIDDNNSRITELENQQKALSQELADCEGIEFVIEAFGKAKVETVEQRINSMFAVVRWKMFEKQINGGEVPTCEAMVNGVPFSDVNNADQINAGLDIINAICHYHNVFAPIFVDNAESVNKLLPTNSQVIRLVVTMDNQITVG